MAKSGVLNLTVMATLAVTFYCPDCHQPLVLFQCGAYHCVNIDCPNSKSVRPE